MPVTYLTIAWALLALISIAGLYFFNSGKNLFAFVTSQKYLILFLCASLLGMREQHLIALSLVIITLCWMYYNYIPYVEKCKEIKVFKEFKQ